MAIVYQTDVMQDMSFLLGESSVPSTGTDDRQRFIQRALDRVYRAYNWPMNKIAATLPMVGGIASLPANFHQDSNMDIRVVNPGVGDDNIFSQVGYDELDGYPTNQYRYRLSGYEGAYLLESSEPTLTTTLNIYYETTSPIINASVGTPFPSSMCLARGALVYYRVAENPQADIAQEEYLFQQELDEVISQYNRSRPQPRAKTLHEAMGTYPGDITNVNSFNAN
jgi:hypothetical protein